MTIRTLLAPVFGLGLLLGSQTVLATTMPGAFTANHVVARLLLPQGVDYEAAREAFSPFDRIQAQDDVLRANAAELWRRCASTGRTLWCFVGNKAEGSAPLTARAIQQRIIG